MFGVATLLILLAQPPVAKPTITYFPSGVIDPYPRLDNFIIQWYSKSLTYLREPSVFDPVNSVHDSYRFTYLRAFSEPIAVRLVVQNDGTAELHLKRGEHLEYMGKRQPFLDESRMLTKEETAACISAIEQSGFWADDPKRTQTGTDGSDWIFEGRKSGNYHVVVRWYPQKGKMRELGLFFLKTARLKLYEREIY